MNAPFETTMKRLGSCLRTLIALVVLLPALAQSPAVPPVGAGKGKTIVLPESYLRGYDPITIFFPGETGPKGGGAEDQPQKVVRIEPEVPGEFRWVDARTLLFKPAVPWPALERYRIVAGGVEKVLHTLMVPPNRLNPADGTTDLDDLKEITLSFAEPLSKEKLARMVTFDVRPLPGTGERGAKRFGKEDFTIKALERASAQDPASYALRFNRPISGGRRILMNLRLSLEARGPEAAIHYSFKTRVPFRVVAAGCATSFFTQNQPVQRAASEPSEADGEEGDGGENEPRPEPASEEPSRATAAPTPGLLPIALGGSRFSADQALDGGIESPRIALQFSADLAPLSLSAVKALVHFSPSIPDLAFTQSGAFLYLTGKIERETLYRVEIRSVPVRDMQGRALRMDGPSEFHFLYHSQPSYLRWAQSEGIVERYGPQMFPLSGRGDAAVDLRIYKVNPLDRSAWPFPKSPISLNEGDRPPGPGEEPEPGSAIPGYLRPHDLAQRLRLLGSPAFSRLVNLPLRAGGGATSFGLPLKEALVHIAGPDQPGTYLLGIRRLNGQTTRDYVRIQVTDLCLTTVEEGRGALFLVTSLRTGKPVQGATIRVEGLPDGAANAAWVAMLSGTTDVNGRFRYVHQAQLKGEIRRIVVQNGEDTLVILPSDPPYAFSNNHWFGPSGTWLDWLRSEPKEDDGEAVTLAHLLTERPVYRPEEPVFLKGYLRVRDRGRLKFAPKAHYEVVITDPVPNERTFPVELTEAGSFALTFQEKDLPTGEYRAVLRNIETQATFGGVDWKMEAYRIPRFEVKLVGLDTIPMDREFTVSAIASYFAGGKVVGQDVRWRVTQFPYAFAPSRREGWVFSSDERFSKGGRFEPPAAIEKSGKTDATGTAAIVVNPALEIDARPRKYVFEATVTGADDQTVTAVKEVAALPPFLLGLKVDRFIKGDKTIHPSVLALNAEGQPLAGQEVSLRLLKRQWHSHLKETDFSQGKAKYVTDVVEEVVTEQKLTTTVDPLSLDLPVREAGIYIVEVSSRDALGRLQVVMVDLYVAGDEALSWKKPQQNVFETATDKKEYGPGETAQILLKSPFQQAHVLAVVEGPDGNTYHHLEVVGGKAVFELPIRNEFNPRIPVHFVLMRGRLPGSRLEGALDLGKPTTVAATQWVRVNPERNRLELKVEHPARALPGQKITVKFHLRDKAGKPLPGEVTLALVDMAVLSLGKEKRLDPLPSFIRDVKSRVTVRDTRNNVIGELVTEESPGGDGSDQEGNDLFGKVTVRKRFKTVPYYNPRIIVGESGEAEVTFELSDDLTTFKVKAVACSGSDRFGFSQSTLAVRLPVLVQPALPRFARAGDQFTAGGIGRIVEGDGGPGHFQIQVQGARILGEEKGTLTWVKDKPERLYVPMTVGVPLFKEGMERAPELTVKLAVRRDADGAADAFETRIPILPDREPVTIQAFRRFQGTAPMAMPSMKEPARPGSVHQSVLVSDQEAILKMVSGLNYLFSYPHTCTEQYVSRALPSVALKDIYKVLDLKASQGQADTLVRETFDFLGKTLQADGLYSFWPGQRGYVHLTAYVVEFLVEARKAGYDFDSKLLDRPLAALKQALRSDYSRFVDGASYAERADALVALAKAGQFDPAYGLELARKAKQSDLYGESRILQAYQATKASTTVMEDLRKDLWEGTIFKLQDGNEVYGGLQSRRQWSNARVLSSEIKTEASLVRALFPKDGQNPKLRMIINDLVASGAGDGWGSTQANAAALLALRDVVLERREVPRREFRVAFGDGSQTLRTGPEHPSASLQTTSEAPGSVVPLMASDGLFARLSLTYMPRALGDHVAARSDGFVVRRELIHIHADGSTPSRAWIDKEGQSFAFAPGDVVEEHIQVINPEDRTFVAVVAPFAAGMEPMNPNLATAPQEAKPTGRMTQEASYAMYLDSEVRFYYESLPKGTYDFYFRLRASTVGTFTHPAAHAEMMYQPLKRGNSPGSKIEVKAP